MARRFLSGVLWGTLASAATLVVLSETGGTVTLAPPVPPGAVTADVPAAPGAPAPPDGGGRIPEPEGMAGGVAMPDIDTPGAPPSPDAEGETALPATAPASTPDAAPPDAALDAPDPGAETALAAIPAGDEPVLPTPEGAAPEAASREPAPAAETGAPAAPEPEPEPEPEVAAVAVEPEPAPEPEAEPAPEPEQPAAALAPAATATPGTPAPSMPGDRVGTFTDRAAAEPAEPEGQGEDAPAATIAEADPDAPAITRNAVPFDNPDGAPLLAVVLIDAGADDAPEAALPFPVTYAIDVTAPGAAARAAELRAAGAEVAAIVELPQGAAPSDAAVTLDAGRSLVPGAVALMDTPAATYQGDRQTAAQVVETARESGHGIVTYARGLNATAQVAAREGVPAGIVFRVFDGDGRDAAAMKRFLDQAAFRAGQQAGVILVGRNSAETVAALAEWRLGTRAETVALAPLSAVLLAE